MTIPDFQTIMLPLLELSSDGKNHNIHDVIDTLGKHFNLTDEELNELIPSGQKRFSNRVGWARTYLTKAGLLEMEEKAIHKITARGLYLLTTKPTEINKKLLEQYPEFIEFKKRKSQHTSTSIERTPEEIIDDAYEDINEKLAGDILEQVMKCSPSFFEQLVVDLLVKMGYGGSREDAARAVGKRGDGGVDGIIDEDRLGLDTIYIQAKRWEGTVSRPEIQKFVGALAGKKANKGIFITTSSYSNEATTFVKTINQKVILIDGERLAELMIESNVGVTEVTSYPIKRLDSDFFNGM
jgi:restriction system protein